MPHLNFPPMCPDSCSLMVVVLKTLPSYSIQRMPILPFAVQETSSEGIIEAVADTHERLFGPDFSRPSDQARANLHLIALPGPAVV